MFPNQFLSYFDKKPLLNDKIRIHILSISALAGFGGILQNSFNIPFTRIFLPSMVVSSTVHLFYYINFKHLKYPHLLFLSIFNIVLMGLVIHSTGGILSPYTIIFAAILVSNISFGIATPFDLPIVIGIYVLVICLEYFGIIPQPTLSAADIYKNSAGTIAFIILSILAFILMSSYFEKLMLNNLQHQINVERHKNEKYLEQINEMNSMYQIGFMVSQILHELCNPLTTIYGYITLILQSYELNSDLKKDMDTIHKEVNHLNDIVRKLKLFVKPGEGKKENFLLNEIFDVAITILKMNENFKDINFIKNFDNSVKYMVWGCRDEIQQVLFNLMKNSVEAIIDANRPSNDKYIEIHITNEIKHVRIMIKDNGRGMREEELKNIFKNFFTTKKEGWGLGMGIVKSILDSHQSALDIKSNFGIGTEVVFSLTVAESN